MANPRWQMNARPQLRAGEVDALHRVIGGDVMTEWAVLRFIAARYGARSLFFLPRNVAAGIKNRPGDFLRAAKQFEQPELRF